MRTASGTRAGRAAYKDSEETLRGEIDKNTPILYPESHIMRESGEQALQRGRADGAPPRVGISEYLDGASVLAAGRVEEALDVLDLAGL